MILHQDKIFNHVKQECDNITKRLYQKD